MDRCWAESYCKGYPDKCGWDCVGNIQLSALYAQSNMPRKYQYPIGMMPCEEDLEAFRFLKDFMLDIEDNVQAGRGLFIYSPNKGNGKTTWACKIMNHHFRKIALRNNLRCRGVFIPVPEYLQDLRALIDEPSEKLVEKMADLAIGIEKSDLVIWDDIGASKHSEWVRDRLFTYINRRESFPKAQIFTSNLSLEELTEEDRLGSRIISRIKGQCEIVELYGVDMRGERL